jgi:hypothetical protein
MRISDIHFREVEALDLQNLLSDDPAKNYSQQVRLDPVTEERAEIIDINDWRETLLRLCKTPTASVWMQTPN